MQAEHLEQIGKEFEGMVRSIVPLGDADIRGPRTLQEAAAWVFA